MGMPILTLVSPEDGLNFIDRMLFFDINYSDPIDTFAADRVLLEADKVASF